MKYKAVVVGCGAIGVALEGERNRPKPATHAGAFSKNPKTRPVAFVDTDKKKLTKAHRAYPDTRVYTDLAKCLREEQPDIVAIATPPASRLHIVRECLKAKVPMVICEKPLSESHADAQKIARMAAASKSTFVVNYQRRFYPLIASVKKDIEKGAIGRLQQVSCFYSNGIYNNGGHLIDTVRYVLGDDIVSAKAFVSTRNKTHLKGDLNVDCVLRTKKGLTVAMQSFDQKAYGVSEIRIYGEKGAIFIRDYGFTVVRVPCRSSVFDGVRQLDYDRGRTITKPLSAVAGALEHVIACHESRKKPVSSARTAAEIVRILDMIARSANS